jgi:hypothetical protein
VPEDHVRRIEEYAKKELRENETKRVAQRLSNFLTFADVNSFQDPD